MSPHAAAVSVDAAQLSRVEQIYRLLDRPQVLRFLEGHAFLLPLLVEVQGRIAEFFPGRQLLLSVSSDPETENRVDADELLLSITTELETAEAMERLDRLDKAWWLNALPEAQGKLCIDLAFR